ncbi:hypothetical protein CkaCkLH20_12713 [Colletotrichum karsti]|uniref:DUF3824 domain-containing protein n=1 Tax=Colletotrichum karsti TaxID=1095194 RepID=A0A9P6HWX4_9PEZI|nr:uncharacterized protein CkaCkLH20_12713 [Colletotrichum karsti]KAF9869796.1 hypothetical protein CkaCkLH20_12713 [Colletotrichum karsti]
MSYYDDQPQRTRRYVREERREERVDPRYAEDPYLRVYESRQLVPRGREDSELSIEEVRRDFPPPGYRDSRRTRSAEPGYYDEYRGYDDRDRYYDRERDYDRRGKKAGSLYYEEEKRSRQRVLNQQEKILAAVAGAALAFGGKELYDRKEAKEHGGDVERNYLTSAALGAAGALAGYQGAEFYSKHKEKDEKNATYVLHRGRDGRVTEYYSDEEGEKEKKGSKSFLENALAASGLGAAVKALTGAAGGGHHDDRRSDTRSRRGSPDSRGTARSRSRGPGGEAANKMQKAAMASLIAGATEAFRVAKEPGSWKGEKTKRILTAAAGAATIDAAHSGEKQSKLGLAESVIGGLVGNRVINGSKRNIEEDRRTGRSRSRSRARSDGGGGGPGLAALATAGLGAFGAKKAIENVRSRSRGPSADSYDSRASSRSRDGRHQRSRSRSVVDSARKKLAKIGLGSDPDDRERDRARDDSHYDDRGSRRTVSRKYSDEYDDGYDRGYGRGGRDAYDDDRSSYTSRRRDRSRRRGGKSDASSDSDLGDSDDDEKRAKKMRGKQVITTGLAAVATIHAAHGVYQSMEKRNARQKAVREGRLSPQEAKKLKSKAILQDAASVGIAALGIKGAWSELKEAKELTHECKQFQQEKAIRHQKRIERQRRLRGDDGGRRSRDDDWYTSSSPRADRYDYGPVYLDSNPYAAGPLPAPPVGYDRR